MLVVLALVVATTSRVVIVAPESGRDEAVERAIGEGATHAGVEVVGEDESLPCDRRETDCLVRISALHLVDGAIAWRRTESGIELVVVRVSESGPSRSERAMTDVAGISNAAARAITIVFAPAPLPAPAAVSETPLAPPPAASSPPPLATDSSPLLAWSLAIGGGVVGVAAGAVAVALDLGLESSLQDAAAHRVPVPGEFDATQGAFFVATGVAIAGGVAAGVGLALLATE